MMRTKKTVILSVVMIALLFPFCEKDESSLDIWIKGLWIGNHSDSLCFSTFLYINNGLPYDYNFHEDSLRIFPTWSSNLSDWRSYKIVVDKQKDELYLYDFLKL